jgi:hypothetical protein
MTKEVFACLNFAKAPNKDVKNVFCWERDATRIEPQMERYNINIVGCCCCCCCCCFSNWICFTLIPRIKFNRVEDFYGTYRRGSIGDSIVPASSHAGRLTVRACMARSRAVHFLSSFPSCLLIYSAIPFWCLFVPVREDSDVFRWYFFII